MDCSYIFKRFPVSTLCLDLCGCSLILLVTRSWKALCLVKYWIRYFGTKLFKQAKIKIDLCSILLEAKLNQLEDRVVRLLKLTFHELFELNGFVIAGDFGNILWRFHPAGNISIVKYQLRELSISLFRSFQREAWSYTSQRPKPTATHILDVIFFIQYNTQIAKFGYPF